MRMVDLDNTYEYSEVVFIKMDCEASYLENVFPNPTPKSATVTVRFVTRERPVLIKLIDMTGRVVASYEYEAMDGVNDFKLPVQQ
ncbi:MAG: T9SS type A sorting domain-containing protein, partial [Bacteroidota bacterium]